MNLAQIRAAARLTQNCADISRVTLTDLTSATAVLRMDWDGKRYQTRWVIDRDGTYHRVGPGTSRDDG